MIFVTNFSNCIAQLTHAHDSGTCQTHLWTVSTEFQMYLVTPLFAWLYCRSARAGVASALLVVAAALAWAALRREIPAAFRRVISARAGVARAPCSGLARCASLLQAPVETAVLGDLKALAGVIRYVKATASARWVCARCSTPWWLGWATPRWATRRRTARRAASW